jgi:hypothetical protein
VEKHMTYRSKLDVWIVAAILFGWAVLLAGADRWIVMPVLVILMMCAYPESYVTAPAGLVVRGVLSRRLVPYERISFVGVATGGVRVGCQPGWEFTIAPAERDAFLADMAARAPHLLRCGQRLVATFALRDRFA